MFMASVLETNAKILSFTHLTELEKKIEKSDQKKVTGFSKYNPLLLSTSEPAIWHFRSDIARLNGPEFIAWWYHSQMNKNDLVYTQLQP